MDITQPASATNRADLGYTGRLLILADLQPADIPSHTFFIDVKANTELIRGADGYVQPGDLLAKSGFNANCFPYMLLADEAKDNRIGVSNGDVVTGNWDPAVGGWQRSNLGPTGDGWTGYDFVHAGQTIENYFVLNADELTGGPVTLQVALLIKYTEPKGVGGEAGRALRLPPATVDVLQFAYRAPHAALDCSKFNWWRSPTDTSGYQGVEDFDVFQLEATVGATNGFACSIEDWDHAAAETASADLAQDAAIDTIDPGSGGLPMIEVDSPGLFDAPQAIPFFTEQWEPLFGPNEQFFRGTLTNDLGGVVGPGRFRDQPLLVRATYASAGDVPVTGRFGVDPQTLAADAGRALEVVTYQAGTFRLLPPPPPWTTMDIDPAASVGYLLGGGTDLQVLIHPHEPADPSDDRLVVIYPDLARAGLVIAQATVLVPTGPADWHIHVIDPGPGESKLVRAAISEGHLGLVYAMQTSFPEGVQERLAFALKETPTATTDWVRYNWGTSGAGVSVGGKDIAALPGGGFIAAVRDQSSDKNQLIQTAQPIPGTAAAWTAILPDDDSRAFARVETTDTAIACVYEVPTGYVVAYAVGAAPADITDWNTLPTVDPVTGFSLRDFFLGEDKWMLGISSYLHTIPNPLLAADVDALQWQVAAPRLGVDAVTPPCDPNMHLLNAISQADGRTGYLEDWQLPTCESLSLVRALMETPAHPEDWALSLVPRNPGLLLNRSQRSAYISYLDAHVVVFRQPTGQLSMAFQPDNW